MEVRFFTETYSPEYGSVFETNDNSVFDSITKVEHCEIIDDADQILDNMGDFKDNRDYKYFVDSIKQASKIITFMNYATFPGHIANIYEVVIE